MPLVEVSTYQPPLFCQNGHIQTIFPSFFRIVTGVSYERERIHTPDGDFLDLDWSRVNSKHLAIVIHGLESSSDANYMKGMIKALNKRDLDAVAINLRGCSGEPNNLFRSYHCGSTDDLHTVVSHILALNCYDRISLVGFSLGGNLTLKYVGEQGSTISPLIHKATAISVPCDLATSAQKMTEYSNWFYMKRFVWGLQKKFEHKNQVFPGKMSAEDLRTIKNFKDIDECYTAPAHGFESAEDYWSKASSKPFIPNIKIPTLLINAQNDPLVSKESFPFLEAKNNKHFTLDAPHSGGHVGFVSFNLNGEYWHEYRVSSFILE